MPTIRYSFDREIPVVAEVEICIVGGGPGGLSAAVTAARQGRDVLLAERFGAPGGMAFYGEVSPFMLNHAGGKAHDRPLYGEWRQAIRSYYPERMIPEAFDPEGVGGFQRMIPKDAAMLAAEDLLLAAKVKLKFHHNLVDAIARDGRIEAAVFSTKAGFVAVRAAVFIDSTGDGDLAALAGCPVELGDAGGHCQPMTLCFKLSGIDRSRLPDRGEINRRFDEARARGDIRFNPRENVLAFDTPEAGIVHFNTTRVIHRSGIDGGDLSAAEIEARSQLREMLAFLRASVPGCEQAAIHSIAHHIGIRETRRIRGREYLTMVAFETCAKYPDGICQVSYPVDIHNPSGTGTYMRSLPVGEWYEIPYGCLVPERCDNLLVGSRCISVDHGIHSSIRVMPPVISIGQAAGMAAAMALESSQIPAELDGRQIRARLRTFGAV
ncbi:MAG: FAD-dependent oxidoreductase [Victivallaceae bacterium]